MCRCDFAMMAQKVGRRKPAPVLAVSNLVVGWTQGRTRKTRASAGGVRRVRPFRMRPRIRTCAHDRARKITVYVYFSLDTLDTLDTASVYAASKRPTLRPTYGEVGHL